ncbi:hypothetical protein [Streptomyces mirabilis]|uniref:hypothetical protein n=1 Tax=Streptomyces mirabilis TaxID=68239 RepID=UPI0036BEF781
MDPVALEQLLYEVRSSHAKTITVPLTSLSPGCVLAGGSWDHHVVVRRPVPVGATRATVNVRHLYGGHTLTLGMATGTDVTIYHSRLDPTHVGLVPTVPRCMVPEDPEMGDRVFQHYHEVHRLGEGRFFEFNGTEWQQVVDLVDRGRCRTTVRTFPLGIRHIVSNPVDPDPRGWYTYLPAGHRPFLYVDGIPVPARTVDELTVGDTIRIPGGGRIRVSDIRRNSSATTLNVTLVRKSRHPMRHFMWDRTEGAVAEHHDSGRTRTLYPTEPRADELINAVGLAVGDTVITAWGLPFSTVAVIDEVYGQELLQRMSVIGTATDGRPVRTVTGLDNRYYLLHRPRPTVAHSRAGWLPRARAHA